MIVFTDGSVQGHHGPKGSGIVIKNPGHRSLPIKLPKNTASYSTSYKGEIEVIKLSTGYIAFKILVRLIVYLFIQTQSVIKAIMAQGRNSYHNETITKIRENLIQISSPVAHIKSICCPAHIGIKENEIADN